MIWIFLILIALMIFTLFAGVAIWMIVTEHRAETKREGMLSDSEKEDFFREYQEEKTYRVVAPGYVVLNTESEPLKEGFIPAHKLKDPDKNE